MAFEDVKEKFISSAKATWERVQDTSTYQQLKDRYENLNPNQQKMAIIGGVLVVLLILLSFPYSAYDDSAQSVGNFETKRGLIRELFKVTKQASEVPSIPNAPTGQALVQQIDGLLSGAQLVPEQIKNVAPNPATTTLIPAGLIDSATIVSLAKLTLIQVIDIGYQLQGISPSIKMTDMTVQNNAEDTRYLDVVYNIVSLKVPQIPMDIPADEPPPGGKKKKAHTGDGGND